MSPITATIPTKGMSLYVTYHCHHPRNRYVPTCHLPLPPYPPMLCPYMLPTTATIPAIGISMCINITYLPYPPSVCLYISHTRHISHQYEYMNIHHISTKPAIMSICHIPLLHPNHSWSSKYVTYPPYLSSVSLYPPPSVIYTSHLPTTSFISPNKVKSNRNNIAILLHLKFEVNNLFLYDQK